MLTLMPTTPTTPTTPRTPKNPSPSSGKLQTTILILGVGLVLWAAFFFLSTYYFEGKRQFLGADPMEQRWGAVFAFTILVIVTMATSVCSVYFTKWASHILAGIAGLGALLGAYLTFMADKPAVLAVSLFVIGVLFALLAWRSLEKSRAGWAFLVAMCFTMGAIMLFGAPKLRTVAQISMWTAFIIPLQLIVAGVGLSMLGKDYREQS